MVFIGMPGLEKRLARYPQLYSRIGFVHEFRALSHADVRQLLKDRWSPPEVSLPDDGLADEESIAMILRVTGGNFRLLHRLLTQIGRVLELNKLTSVTTLRGGSCTGEPGHRDSVKRRCGVTRFRTYHLSISAVLA